MPETTSERQSQIDYDEIAPRDVIGFHVFNPETGIGNGEVVGMRQVRGEPHFACEAGDKTVTRPVDRVMSRLREQGYELCTEPWEVAESIDESTGIDESEIQDRAKESWAKLAGEFGVTESEIRDIIVG